MHILWNKTKEVSNDLILYKNGEFATLCREKFINSVFSKTNNKLINVDSELDLFISSINKIISIQIYEDGVVRLNFPEDRFSSCRNSIFIYNKFNCKIVKLICDEVKKDMISDEITTSLFFFMENFIKSYRNPKLSSDSAKTVLKLFARFFSYSQFNLRTDLNFRLEFKKYKFLPHIDKKFIYRLLNIQKYNFINSIDYIACYNGCIEALVLQYNTYYDGIEMLDTFINEYIKYLEENFSK